VRRRDYCGEKVFVRRRVPDARMEIADAESTARALFLRMGRSKWRIVQMVEIILRPLLRVLPKPALISPTERVLRILVIEYWNLGDLAILVPFLTRLRKDFPAARIALLVNTKFESFLGNQGLVDEFIPIRVPWAQHFSRWKKYNPFSGHLLPFLRVIWSLRKNRFDWVFSGRMDIRDNFLMWLSGTPRRIGYGIGGGGFLLTDRVFPDLSRPHRADVWLQLLSAVGVPAQSQSATFEVSKKAQEDADGFLRARRVPQDAVVVGFHTGARIPIRRWGDERFTEVALDLLHQQNVHVIWFSEPGSDSHPPSHDRCHAATLDFALFLAVLSRCQSLVCNDSGPMHLANLLGVPVVAVFGSTNPVWFGPRGALDRVVIRPEMWCRPCFDYCIFDQPHCLRAIEPKDVLQAATDLLSDVQPRAEGASAPAMLVQIRGN
jgi:lipopolysaccharide heptosyltransferase II